MRGRSSSGSRHPDSKPGRKSVKDGGNLNRGTASASCASGTAALRRASSRTNVTAPTTTVLQVSLALTLGDVVEP